MSLRNLPGEPTKQNADESRARGFKAQQVPWTTGLKIAENGCTIILSHVLANDYN